MKKLLILLCIAMAGAAQAQELFLQTEPASNMPRHSIGLRMNTDWMAFTKGSPFRLRPELMYGVSAKLMVHLEGSFSDYYSLGLVPEGFNVYAKYRFLSIDGVQTHSRAALYGRLAYSGNNQPYAEVNLQGDNSGAEAGIVFTQLLHRLALSCSGGVQKVAGFADGASQLYRGGSFSYTASAGYLVLPRVYENYRQVNFNIYAELLGRKNDGLFHPESIGADDGYFVDIAPGIQCILNSINRIDLSYRTQLSGNMNRYATRSVLLRYEYNIFRK